MLHGMYVKEEPGEPSPEPAFTCKRPEEASGCWRTQHLCPGTWASKDSFALSFPNPVTGKWSMRGWGAQPCSKGTCVVLTLSFL